LGEAARQGARDALGADEEVDEEEVDEETPPPADEPLRRPITRDKAKKTRRG
jgi:hypothetical protein